MGANYLLKIDGIEGESEEDGHEKEIKIESFRWCEVQPVAKEADNPAAGTADIHDVEFTMSFNKSSPLLFQACAAGDPFKDKEAIFTIRRAEGDAAKDFIVWKFKNFRVSSYQTDGSQSSIVPTDRFTLTFNQIQVEYTPPDEDGTVAAGWNKQTKKKL